MGAREQQTSGWSDVNRIARRGLIALLIAIGVVVLIGIVVLVVAVNWTWPS